MHQLQNAIHVVDIDPQNGCFSIQPNDNKFPSVSKSHLGCTYLLKGRSHKAIGATWQCESID
jgi:hypothetical protein